MDALYVSGREPRGWQKGGARRVLAGLHGALTAARLVLLYFVAGPAALLTTIVTVAMLCGLTSQQALVQDLYTYAASSFRAAPAGMIQVRTCADPISAGPVFRNQYGDTLGCQHPRMMNVPTSRVVAEKLADIRYGYWLLFGCSSACLTLFYGLKYAPSLWDTVSERYRVMSFRIRRGLRYAKWVRAGRQNFPPL